MIALLYPKRPRWFVRPRIEIYEICEGTHAIMVEAYSEDNLDEVIPLGRLLVSYHTAHVEKIKNNVTEILNSINEEMSGADIVGIVLRILGEQTKNIVIFPFYYNWKHDA
jgi:hypothetical protein